ncbi:hypothetical protein Ndes2526B_g01700 [Nannochloris sp. 'desiccata']
MISTSHVCASNFPLQIRCHNLTRRGTTAVVSDLPSDNTKPSNSFLAAKRLIATGINTRVNTSRSLLISCNASKRQQNNNAKSASPASSSFVSPSPELSDAIDNSFFRLWLPLAVAAGMLMLFDAAYSGDWSRIGVITKDQEVTLRAFVPVAVGGHAVCCVVAGYISKQRGEVSWLSRSIKALAAGFVGLIEVVLLPEERVDKHRA